MVSSIISNTIDETFPVAGQDNDSQGFRDNFSIIKTALSVANAELTDLQDNSARLDENNNFLGNTITNAVLSFTKLETNTTYGSGLSESSKIVSFSEGYVHVIQSDVPNLILSISNVPIENYMCMRLILSSTVSSNITINSTFGGATIITDGNPAWTGNVINVNSTNPTVIEVFSYDNLTLFLRYIGNFS